MAKTYISILMAYQEQIMKNFGVKSLKLFGSVARNQDTPDFLETPAGMEKLDAVCMQLIAIGEAVNIQNNSYSLQNPIYLGLQLKA